MKKLDWISIAIAVAVIALLGCALAWFFSALGVYAEVVSVARDIIVAMAAVIGAGVAVRGLEEWNRQFNTKIDHGWAHPLLKAVLQLRDVVRAFRDEVTPNEALEALKQLGEPIPDKGAVFVLTEGGGKDAAYRVRLQNLRSAEAELQTAIDEAQVFWKRDEAGKVFCPLWILIGKLRRAHDTCFSERSGLEFKKGLLEEQWAIIEGTADDDFGRQVAQAVDDIRAWLSPMLRA